MFANFSGIHYSKPRHEDDWKERGNRHRYSFRHPVYCHDDNRVSTSCRMRRIDDRNGTEDEGSQDCNHVPSVFPQLSRESRLSSAFRLDDTRHSTTTTAAATVHPLCLGTPLSNACSPLFAQKFGTLAFWLADRFFLWILNNRFYDPPQTEDMKRFSD